jgi:transposase
VHDVTTFESGFETSANVQTQRLEVVPDPSGRRRWTAEAKGRIIAESFEPGANVSDVARRNSILPQQLYAWRREVRDRLEGGDTMTFVPAMVADGKKAALAGGDAEIRIELAGMVVRVPETASADHLERVLLAIQVAT